jgi:multidrug efflux pump
VIASGASSKSQQALGTGVVGGMIAVVVLALIMVPAFFVVVQKVFNRVRNEDAETTSETEPADGPSALPSPAPPAMH